MDKDGWSVKEVSVLQPNPDLVTEVLMQEVLDLYEGAERLAVERLHRWIVVIGDWAHENRSVCGKQGLIMNATDGQDL